MARRGRPTDELRLSDEERDTLERWARRPKSAQALAPRCRIVLECTNGGTDIDVAGRLGVSRMTVGKWRLWSSASTVSTTSPGPVHHAPSAATTSNG